MKDKWMNECSFLINLINFYYYNDLWKSFLRIDLETRERERAATSRSRCSSTLQDRANRSTTSNTLLIEYWHNLQLNIAALKVFKIFWKNVECVLIFLVELIPCFPRPNFILRSQTWALFTFFILEGEIYDNASIKQKQQEVNDSKTSLSLFTRLKQNFLSRNMHPPIHLGVKAEVGWRACSWNAWCVQKCNNQLANSWFQL